jgi:glycosyltransferase involved in cell wall biosynthesis
VRKKLGITEGTRVYIYSGGISNEWHVTEKMFGFLDHLFRSNTNQSLICLMKDSDSLNRILDEYSNLKSRCFVFSVPNHEVCQYLNAADYGILFRENTIMNNVASPTKFAEYMLCGLPVIISEGVGDYSEYIVNEKVGVLIKQMELQTPECFDNISFLNRGFDRKLIAEIGRERFSKESILKNLLKVFIS